LRDELAGYLGFEENAPPSPAAVLKRVYASCGCAVLLRRTAVSSCQVLPRNGVPNLRGRVRQYAVSRPIVVREIPMGRRNNSRGNLRRFAIDAPKKSIHPCRRVCRLTFVPENEVDVVLGGANPNPRKVGCPPQRLLLELARRERSISDPWYDHLCECSPCYREARALQQAAGEWRGTVH